MAKMLLNPIERKRLLENFISLSVLQAANYILPLITLPYLVRVLGPNKFGLIAFAQSLINYFIILTDYGFNLSGTQEISIVRNDKEKISKIFSTIIVIKLILLTISFIILSLLIFNFNKFKVEWEIYYFTFISVVGNIFFPIFFFQGLEKMKYITLLNIVSRLIFIVGIFTIIKSPSDYIYVPLIGALSMVTIGFISIIVLFYNFKIHFILPDWKSILEELKEGWYIFASQLSVSLFTNSNIFILGIFTNNTIVAYFAAAERIIKAIINLSVPISTTIYPFVCKLFVSSRDMAFVFLRKVLKIFGSIFFIVSILTFIFAPQIVNITLGHAYSHSGIVLRLLSLLPLSIFLDNIFGTQILLNTNQKRIFMNILIIGGILNILLAIISVPFLKHVGTSISYLTAELFICITMYYYACRVGFSII